MKSREIPQGLLIGAIVLAVVIVGVIAYSMFGRAPAQVDPANVSADRLRDPDPPRVGQVAGGGANKRRTD